MPVPVCSLQGGAFAFDLTSTGLNGATMLVKLDDAKELEAAAKKKLFGKLGAEDETQGRYGRWDPALGRGSFAWKWWAHKHLPTWARMHTLPSPQLLLHTLSLPKVGHAHAFLFIAGAGSLAMASSWDQSPRKAGP